MKYIILTALVYPSFKISLHKHQQVDVVLWQKGETDQHFLIVKIKKEFLKKIYVPSCILQLFWWL